MKQETLNNLNKSFNSDQIKRRKGNGGNYPYLETHVVIQRLNEALGGEWSFEILDHKILEREVIVQGKLTCLTDTNITKSAFGSSQIKRYEGTDKIISLGDDMSNAAKKTLHDLVDDLSEQEAAEVKALVDRYRSEGLDPMLKALAMAPIDDEPTTAEDMEDAKAGWEEYQRGNFTTAEDLKRELLE